MRYHDETVIYGFKNDFQTAWNWAFDFIGFVAAFLNCFNFKGIKSLEADSYLM